MCTLALLAAKVKTEMIFDLEDQGIDNEALSFYNDIEDEIDLEFLDFHDFIEYMPNQEEYKQESTEIHHLPDRQLQSKFDFEANPRCCLIYSENYY